MSSHCSTFVLTDLSVRLCTTCFIFVSIVQRALCYRFQNLVETVFLSFSGCKDSGCRNQIQIYFPLFSNFSQNRRFSRPKQVFLKSSNDKNVKFEPFSGLQNGRLRTFLSRKLCRRAGVRSKTGFLRGSCPAFLLAILPNISSFSFQMGLVPFYYANTRVRARVKSA